MIELPTMHLETGHAAIDRAFRLALGDILGNVRPYQSGLLATPAPVLTAGLDYPSPWTRDAAINVWNGAALLLPQVCKNTLLAQIERRGAQPCLIDLPGGSGVDIQGNCQGWDAIIWTIGAYQQFLYTGDREFLTLAYEVTRHALDYFEDHEYDAATGLFRGAAVYGDGVAAYPDVYADDETDRADISTWPQRHPDLRIRGGYGLPMQVLSTNSVFYRVYVLAERMAQVLDLQPPASWGQSAKKLRAAINHSFWMPERGRYRYLLDPWGGCDRQEGLGLSFALLFGIADGEQVNALYVHTHSTPWGLPCLWPSYERYGNADGTTFGRHSGTIWPFINAFWAHAAALHGRTEVFAREFLQQGELANRCGQFREIHHPITGEPYGGEQGGCRRFGMDHWESMQRQTWSATGFLRMVLYGIVGCRFAEDGLSFAPLLPPGFDHVVLDGLCYRNSRLRIEIEGPGRQIAKLTVNGRRCERISPATEISERYDVRIRLAED